MQRFAYIFCSLALCLASCAPAAYDDSAVVDRLDDMEQRIEELEKQYGKAQEDIEALRTLIGVLQSRDYITSVTPILEGEEIVGYTITFANSDPITINTCGCKEGEEGEDCIIVGIVENETEVIITLSDGSTITIPKGSAPTPTPAPTDYCEKLEDVEFMRYCYEKFDINGDKILSESEANAIRAVNIDSKKNIYSVKGIEYFVNLESFQAYNAIALRTLDFSKNTNLRTIKEQALYKCSGLSKFTARRLPHRHWNNTPLRQPLMGVKSLFRKARSMRTKRLGATLPTRFTENRDYRTALIPRYRTCISEHPQSPPVV